MKSIGMSKIGLVRQRNEDRFYIGDSFCIVTDGMGGYKGGEIASTMVVDTLAADMQRWQDVSADALRQAVAKANMAVYDWVKTTPALEGMGTTAVVAYVTGSDLYWANVGDSRLYVFHEDRLTQISTDHSMVQALYEAGELKADDMLQHPQRNVLTRAVGVGPVVDIDAGVYKVINKAHFRVVSQFQEFIVFTVDADFTINRANQTRVADRFTLLIQATDNGGIQTILRAQ